ncbi:hypothetical protein SNE40_019152 [Patella caerulea]|uniref:Uncharacterized protein n=1 Tax=Patella caerulea TaxID=87958 RepID=A0AAN8J6K1_PATCE
MAGQRRYPQTFDVFVGNLPEDADQKKVGKLFNKYGEIAAIIVRDSNHPGQKLAYVKYLCEEDAKRAIEDGNKMEIGPNKLVVRRAEPRKRPGVNMMKDNKPILQMGLSQKEPDLVSNIDTASNSSKDMMEEYVTVTHAETPITVFAQTSNEDNLKEIQNVLTQLAELCPSAPKLSGPVEYSKVYASKFFEDNQWYRCQVKQILGTDKVKIQYIDYGNSEEIDPSSLVEIPQEITNYSPFAQKLVLHNLRSKDLSCPKGIAFLQELTVGKVLRAILRRRLTDGSGYYAELFEDGESIIDKVVAEGHGVVRQLQKPIGMGDDMKMGMNRNNNNPREMMQSLSGLDKSALQAKKRELDKVSSERDILNLELSNMRGKMKNLQSEFSAVSNKLMENNLNQMLQVVMNLASKVKHIRSQFPDDKNTPLDEAIKIISGENKLKNIQIESLPPVVSTLSTYRAAQKEISLSKDKTELIEMVTTRDAARSELFDKLNVCVAELKKYPLQERGTQVMNCMDVIERNYSYFINFLIPSPNMLSELGPAYQDWKEKKKQESEQCRQQTDTCKQAVLASLMQFHSLLSLEDMESADQQVNIDIDGQLKHYISALQSEISKSDTESVRDSAFLANLVQSLYKELQQERSCIDNYTQLLTEFQQMITDIEPWLNCKPSTTELQSTRKTLRSLKSKLRHRIADKEDHEENEGEGDELDEIKTDINEIRNEIHQILIQESKQLNKMSKLAEAHFPEVLSEFTDFGIDTQLTYQGLVKDSYEIEHFDLTPVSDMVNDLYESVFCGETVYIKDYILGDQDHLQKDQFINQCFTFSQIQDEYLHSIDTVFFDKSGRHGYIKSPKEGELLTSVMESGIRPNSKAIQQIIRCVSKGLGALHAKSFIHADITPLNIIMRDDGSAVLMEPDFSRSVTDRCRKKYVTKSGLEFVPPEIRNMAEVTPSVDLYNLGLLILWLHYPDSNVALLPDNVPDFTSLPLDQSTQMILRSLLSSISHLRPTVELLLQSPYHTMDLPDNLIISQPSNPFNPPTCMASHGGGDRFTMTSISVRHSEYTTSSTGDINKASSPFPEVQDYPTTSTSSHIQQNLVYSKPSSSHSEEPFEIGTFDLADAMSSIPDQVEESGSDNTPSQESDFNMDQNEITKMLEGAFPSDNIVVSAELQNLSVAENTNNSNIEAEKLKQESERESSTPDSFSDEVQSENSTEQQ